MASQRCAHRFLSSSCLEREAGSQLVVSLEKEIQREREQREVAAVPLEAITRCLAIPANSHLCITRQRVIDRLGHNHMNQLHSMEPTAGVGAGGIPAWGGTHRAATPGRL